MGPAVEAAEGLFWAALAFPELGTMEAMEGPTRLQAAAAVLVQLALAGLVQHPALEGLEQR